jgi:hypothetical protein
VGKGSNFFVLAAVNQNLITSILIKMFDLGLYANLVSGVSIAKVVAGTKIE